MTKPLYFNFPYRLQQSFRGTDVVSYPLSYFNIASSLPQDDPKNSFGAVELKEAMQFSIASLWVQVSHPYWENEVKIDFISLKQVS